MTEGRTPTPAPLSPERWRRVSSLFDVLIDLPAVQRPTRLAELCPDDPSLCAEVEAMLTASDRAGEFLEKPVIEQSHRWLHDSGQGSADSHADLSPGDVAGPYRIVRELGRGGMGVVFLAERVEGSRGGEVALKILRRRLDTNTFRRRFQRERAILAVLQHPNIAALIDGGATADGVPFLVMEYVDGKPITSWCDERSTSIRGRLDLFRTACEAVSYAHARHVVHRDLKPANISVTSGGTIKLLDFGIARLVAGGHAGANEALTRAGERLVTPEYAAPEQIRGDAPTMAMDVYALGIVLHELLVGRRPYALPQGGSETLERFVLSAGPSAPSRILTPARSDREKAGAETEEIARLRSTTPPNLRRILRDGLDSIVLRALSPRPERRYVTVSELIQDLRWWSER